MTQGLTSTAPGVFDALVSLVETAAAGQSPAVSVFSFELGMYEPGSYVTVHAIENHEFEPAYIGPFTQYERFDIVGAATVYTGDSPGTNPNVAATVLGQTYALFQACVMTPAMSNRTIPILGGPSNVRQMLPGPVRYVGQPGDVEGRQSGWAGVLEWSLHFEANVTPS